MIRFGPQRAATAIALLLMGIPATGLTETSGDKRFAITFVEEAPTLDGIVASDEWTSASHRTDLLQASPIEFAEPTERTEWFFAFNETTLFVAAIAHYENVDHVTANTMRQGASLDRDDTLNVLIDGSNTKRSGYLFALNANGVRADAIFTNGVDRSDEWDGIWQGAAQRTDTGWSMEMAIPFNTISFDESGSVWGLNFWRDHKRTNEVIAWRSIGGDVNPTGSGEMSGLTNLNQGIGLDVVPAVSAVSTNDRTGLESDDELKPSLDVRYRLTPSLSGLITINTDFAATEVDDRQLGLDRFGVFFPEKRTFFLSDFDIFQFGGIVDGGPGALVGTAAGPNALPFFSRRIGLSDDSRPVDIVAGGKLSGRLGRFDIGALVIRQDEFASVDATNLSVGRVVLELFEESQLGAIATKGDPRTNDENTMYGVDYRYRNTRLGEGRVLEGNFWWQRASDETTSGEDQAISAAFAVTANEGLSAGVQYQEVEADYFPALGFVDRTGVRLYSAEFEHMTKFPDHPYLREFLFGGKIERWEYLDTGTVQSETIQVVPFRFQNKAGDILRVWYQREIEGLLPGEQPLDRIDITLDPGSYEFYRPGFFFRTATFRPLSLTLRGTFGDFYDGERLDIRPEVRWTPNRKFSTSLSVGFNRFKFGNEKRITRQYTWNSEVAFNAYWSLVTNLQYDNLSENLGMNARLRYNIAAGEDVWFVLAHNWVRDELTDRLSSYRTDAVAKVRYTFRF